MAGIDWVIVPSIWWETGPIVVDGGVPVRAPGDLQRHRRHVREGHRRRQRPALPPARPRAPGRGDAAARPRHPGSGTSCRPVSRRARSARWTTTSSTCGTSTSGCWPSRAGPTVPCRRSRRPPVPDATSETGRRGIRDAVRCAARAWLSPSCLLLVGDVDGGGRRRGRRLSLGLGRRARESRSNRASLRSAEPDGDGRGARPRPCCGASCRSGETELAERRWCSSRHGRRSARRHAADVRHDRAGSARRWCGAASRRSTPAPRNRAARVPRAGARTASRAAERYELSAAPAVVPPGAARAAAGMRTSSEAKRRGLHVDRIMAVDERSFYIEGWMHHEDLEVVRLTAVSPEGSRAPSCSSAWPATRGPTSRSTSSWARNRIREKLGFVCFFELDAPSLQRRRLDPRDRGRARGGGGAAGPTVVTRHVRGASDDPARPATSRSCSNERPDGRPRLPGDHPDPGPPRHRGRRSSPWCSTARRPKTRTSRS